MPNRSPKTIRLNVGGTKYEVAKSLIETYPDTMLATMISDHISKTEVLFLDRNGLRRGEHEELFIDRNGHRFQYVLDYMRDQNVYSMVGVSCASIRKEFDYFGFFNIPKDAIDGGSAKLEDDLKTARDSEVIANWIYHEFMKAGWLNLRLVEHVNRSVHYVMHGRQHNNVFNDNWKPAINAVLVPKYGLFLRTIASKDTTVRPFAKVFSFDLVKFGL